MLNWPEKYRPKSLEEIVGNASAIQALKAWAESWEQGRQEKKGAILVGQPGVGKTTCAHALANEFGWGVIELNASDTRNYSAIRRIAGFGASYETFTDKGEFISVSKGGRKLIILDEADNLFGAEDRGGMQAIVETLRATSQPIILIVNDYYKLIKRSGSIRELCMTIRFMAIRKDTIKLLLRKICNKEKVQISSEALTELAERSSGDLRSAINDLQSVCEGKSKVSIEDVYALGYRDNRETIFSALGKIFKTSSLAKARNATKELEEPPDYVILWIDENLPLEYKDLTDLKNGYERLSRADVFLGRILKRQYYDLWAYTNDLLTGGVALAKRTTYRGFTKYQFPSWLSKMGRTRTARDIQKTVLEKIGRLCHTSRAVVREDILHWFKYLFKSQQEFAINIIAKLGLQEEEIAWLLDEKIDSTKVKRLIKASEKLASKKEVTIKEYG